MTSIYHYWNLTLGLNYFRYCIRITYRAITFVIFILLNIPFFSRTFRCCMQSRKRWFSYYAILPFQQRLNYINGLLIFPTFKCSIYFFKNINILRNFIFKWYCTFNDNTLHFKDNDKEKDLKLLFCHAIQTRYITRYIFLFRDFYFFSIIFLVCSLYLIVFSFSTWNFSIIITGNIAI